MAGGARGGAVLKHVVMFRRKRDVTQDAAREKVLTDRMAALGAQIPVIRGWTFVANEIARPICWDYLLDSVMDDAPSLDAYLFHPLHQALVADLKPYFEWVAVDYTV